MNPLRETAAVSQKKVHLGSHLAEGQAFCFVLYFTCQMEELRYLELQCVAP